MYLFINDNGVVRKSSQCSEKDMAAAGNGYLNIIDITNPELPVRCNSNMKWCDVDRAGWDWTEEEVVRLNDLTKNYESDHLTDTLREVFIARCHNP